MLTGEYHKLKAPDEIHLLTAVTKKNVFETSLMF